MAKVKKNGIVCPIQKVGASYPEEIKRKIVYEIQSGFHSHRTAAKLYGISRNTINAWIIKYSYKNHYIILSMVLIFLTIILFIGFIELLISKDRITIIIQNLYY